MKNDKVRSHKRITTEMTKYIGQKAMFCSPEILNKLAHMRKALGTIRISEAFYHIVLKIYKSMLGKILKRFVDPILRNLRSIHEHVFTIREIINKTTQQQINALVDFIDVETAQGHQDNVSKKKKSKELLRMYLIKPNRATFYSETGNQRHSMVMQLDGEVPQRSALRPRLWNILNDSLRRMVQKLFGLRMALPLSA
ncbi:hypothetical protein QE152_g8223 [Popillia japonica]|uniref:Uncharacterized protein n=1 Tax=Popillia japonica TaxID=7064 RepID=A0AAW1M546_POPJA